MKNPLPCPCWAALCAVAWLTTSMAEAQAPMAGSSNTSAGVSVSELKEVAMGYSVRRTLLDRPVLNGAGETIGKVDDLVISPDRKLSYLIVGAGGFIGFGRYDVAIPVTQIQLHDGKLLMPGASKQVVKSMPRFEYTAEPSKRDLFVANAERDLTDARAKMHVLQQRSTQASAYAKRNIDRQIAAIRDDVKAVEGKLGKLRHATAAEWRALEVDADAAMVRLRKSMS